MASNLRTVLTREEAIEEYKNYVLPYIIEQYEQDGGKDWPARYQAWVNFTDSLCKDKRISDWQYSNWEAPSFEPTTAGLSFP